MTDDPGATGEPGTDDDLLIAELSEAIGAARQVPASILEAGRAALTWLDVDAELAELQADPDFQGVGVRGGPGPERTLSFAASEISVEVEVTAAGLHGQVVPPQAGEIELQQADSPAVTAPVDEVGWFAFDLRPDGLFRLRLTSGEHSVKTTWTRL